MIIMMQSGKKLDDEQLKKVSGGCGQDDASASTDEDRDDSGSAIGSKYEQDCEWSFDLCK